MCLGLLVLLAWLSDAIKKMSKGDREGRREGGKQRTQRLFSRWWKEE